MVILSEFFFVCVKPTAVVDLNPAFILPIFRIEHLGGIFTLLQKKKIDPGMVSQGHLMIIIENVGTIYLVKIKINLIDYNKSKGIWMQVTNNLN